MIKTAARNIQIISPIKRRPFAVRLIALPKSASFAKEITERYGELVETDRTADPFVFLDMFGKELEDEREKYYRMLLTLRLMIAHRLVVSGKISDPTVSGAYSSAVGARISENFHYFRNNESVIYEKLAAAERLIGSDADERTASEIVETAEKTASAADSLIYVFSEGEERYYRELLKSTVRETVYENINYFVTEPQSLILRKSVPSAEDVALPVSAAAVTDGKQETKTIAADTRIERAEAPIVFAHGEPGVPGHQTADPVRKTGTDRRHEDRPDPSRSFVIQKTQSAVGAPEVLRERAAPDISAERQVSEIPAEHTVSEIYAERAVTDISAERAVPEKPAERTVREISPEHAVSHKDTALYAVTLGEGGKYIPRMNTMLSGGAVYFSEITNKYISIRKTPVSLLAPYVKTVTEKRLKDSFTLVIKALDILTSPDKANRQERSVYEYAVSSVYLRRVLPEHSEPGKMFESLGRKERTDVLVLAVKRLTEIAGKESGKNIRYPDGKNKKRTPTPVETALIHAISADTNGELLKEITGNSAPGNNKIVNRLRKFYESAEIPDMDNGLSVISENIERIISAARINGGVHPAGNIFSREYDTRTVKTFETALKLISSGDPEALTQIARVLTEEKIYYTDIRSFTHPMTLRKSAADPDKTVSDRYFESLVERSVVLREIGHIERELIKKKPSVREITRGIDKISLTLGTSSEKHIPQETGSLPEMTVVSRIFGRSRPGREDVSVRMTERMKSAVSAAPERLRSTEYSVIHRGKPTDGTVRRDMSDTSEKTVFVTLPVTNVTRVFLENDFGPAVERTSEEIKYAAADKYASQYETHISSPLSVSGNSGIKTLAAAREKSAKILSAARKAVLGTVLRTGKKDYLETSAGNIVFAKESDADISAPAGLSGLRDFTSVGSGRMRILARKLSVPMSREEDQPSPEETRFADPGTLSHRAPAPAPQPQPEPARIARPTRDELVEQFGNLIEGVDPNLPANTVRMIDGRAVTGIQSEETFEQIRRTAEKTENNAKLIEEITKKQKEIEETLKRTSDINRISGEVYKQLRMQLRFDSSRFM